MAKTSKPQNSKLLQKIEQQREQSKQQTQLIMSEQQKRLSDYTDSALRELNTTLAGITQSLKRVQAQTIPTERAIRNLTEMVEALDRANRRANRPFWHWMLAILLTCAAISAGSWGHSLWQANKLKQLHQLQGAAWLEQQDGEVYMVIAKEYLPKAETQTLLENGNLRFRITNNKAREK